MAKLNDYFIRPVYNSPFGRPNRKNYVAAKVPKNQRKNQSAQSKDVQTKIRCSVTINPIGVIFWLCIIAVAISWIM